MASFVFGEFKSGLTAADYATVMANETIAGLIGDYGSFTEYTGEEGTCYIFEGDEQGFLDELEMEELDIYWHTFRYCGSTHGFTGF